MRTKGPNNFVVERRRPRLHKHAGGVLHLDAGDPEERRGRFARSEAAEANFNAPHLLRRYRQLRMLERAKRISELSIHPRWPLEVRGRRIGTFEAGFSYLDHERGDRAVIEHVRASDAPPLQTQLDQLIIQVAEALHDISIEEIVL